jgi:hypothetical protein
MVRMVLVAALLAAVTVSVVASLPAPAASPPFARSAGLVACDPGATQRTIVILDGVLFGDVRQGRRFLFGWSDRPVLDFPEKLRLIRLLGLKGSAQQLLALPSIRGGAFADEGSYSTLSVRCAGVYHASFVTRSFGLVRLWLQQASTTVRRGYCMPAQLLPRGARVSTEFSVPLGAAAPRYRIDRDADGIIDRTGTFKRGGTLFPVSTRC